MPSAATITSACKVSPLASSTTPVSGSCRESKEVSEGFQRVKAPRTAHNSHDLGSRLDDRGAARSILASSQAQELIVQVDSVVQQPRSAEIAPSVDGDLEMSPAILAELVVLRMG